MYDLPRTIPGVKMLLALAPEVLASTTPPPPEEKERGEVSYGQSAERTVGGASHVRPAAISAAARRGVESRGVPSASRESGGVAQSSSAVNWNPYSVYNNDGV
jgi:hypothetical protein